MAVVERALRRPALPWDAETPVLFDADSGNWIVASYEAVTSVLARPDEFSWEVWDRRLDPIYAGMWAADGRRHADLRALTERCFRARRVQQSGGAARAIADELLDDIIATRTGRVDIVGEFSHRLGGLFMCDLLGLDRQDLSRLIAWRYRQRAAINAGENPALPEMWSYFAEQLERCRSRDGAGLLAELVAAQADGVTIDGEPLTDWDLIGSAWILVSSGISGSNLGYALVLLAEHELLGAARHDTSLVEGTVEESLRLYPSHPVLVVRAREGAEVDGVAIPAGARVSLCLFAANRDATRFPAPHRFDPRRRSRRHLTFGRGAHHCLGAALVRLQLQTAVRATLERLPGLRLDPACPVVHTYGGVFGVLAEAHFLFDQEEAA